MADYTAWPTADDVKARLTRLGLTLRVAGADQDAAIAEALASAQYEVARETGREFLTVHESRYFDGSGTPEQDVDEMVHFGSAAAIWLTGDPDYTLENVAPVRAGPGQPFSRLIIERGGVPGIGWERVFPTGRQNVLVTAMWGFAEAIPRDLWDAVCGRAALGLSSETTWRPAGYVTQVKVGDSSVSYKYDDPEGPEGMQEAFRLVLRRYRRPSGRRLRNLYPKMI